MNLVIEDYERQHTKEVKFFDKKKPLSGISIGEQRKIQDERRKEVLPKYGKRLIIISPTDFGDSKKWYFLGFNQGLPDYESNPEPV